jgi:lysophospholipase L1-like esterase
MRRCFDIAAIAVAMAVLAGLGFVLRPQQTSTIMVAPSAAHVVRPHPRAATRPTTLFIGDSYTGGRGLAEMSYSCMAAVRMGWLCDLSAVPGTGYISGGPANRFIVDPYIGPSTTFAERIPKLAVQYQPDVVILDGGRNDLFPPHDDVFKAMSATIGDVRRAWPTATIVFLRPRLLANPDDDLGFDDGFIARLLAEPAARRMVVLDPIKQFTGIDTSGMLSHDGIHPNQQGEQSLAQALVDSLLGQGFAVTK